MALLTTAQVAERLGVHPSRVRALVREGRLPHRKFGRDLQFEETDLEKLERFPVGWPKGIKRGKREKGEQ